MQMENPEMKAVHVTSYNGERQQFLLGGCLSFQIFYLFGGIYFVIHIKTLSNIFKQDIISAGFPNIL